MKVKSLITVKSKDFTDSHGGNLKSHIEQGQKQDRERPPGGRFAGTWDIPGDLSSGIAPEELSRRSICFL